MNRNYLIRSSLMAALIIFGLSSCLSNKEQNKIRNVKIALIGKEYIQVQLSCQVTETLRVCE
jgi:hypothetical protein